MVIAKKKDAGINIEPVIQMSKIIGDHELDILFREARSYEQYQQREVSDVLLKAIYDLFKMGPTSANCCPARVLFIKSDAQKQLLAPCMSIGNKAQMMNAPVTAIITMDMEFYEGLPRLYPNADAREWFKGNDVLIETTAIRNASLQGAYLIMAARALGLDCGPMSGFDARAVKQAFFADRNWQANFLCNIGYGDQSSLYARSPRYAFDEVCEIR